MRQLVIRPRRGQSVQLLYSGIHDGTLRLILQNGSYVDFTDGEIFLDQRRRGEAPVSPRRDIGIYLVKDERPKVRYQLEGPGRRTDDYTPARVMVSGPGLDADRTDDRLFDEVSFSDPKTVNCDRRYQYGWGVLLNGEPVDIRKGAVGNGERN
jgi:hypothetical protein